MKFTISHKRVNSMHNALNLLGNRFLPNVNADLKIGRLLGIIEDIANPIIAARNKVPLKVLEGEVKSVGDVDKLPQLARELLMARINDAYNDYDLRTVEIEIDEKFIITQNDLPKERSGEAGWENGKGIGVIVASLGPLFEHPKE